MLGKEIYEERKRVLDESGQFHDKWWMILIAAEFYFVSDRVVGLSSRKRQWMGATSWNNTKYHINVDRNDDANKK